MEETEVATKVRTLESEERQTIVHCNYVGPQGYAYRIWPS
ncbi:MAG: hypothetical protein K0S32_3778, partial [Bacteroidetes bacterium]|nr:hypothetical protein [Bacteroidota bacterium]